MGESGKLSKDLWHRQAANLTVRNAVRTRRWGMRITVYNDPGGGAVNGDYVLSYGLADTNLQNNANWLRVAALGATWGGGGAYTFSNALTEVAGAVEWGGALTKNTTIPMAGFNITYTGTGKVTYSPSATLAGINVGSFAGDPSTLSNGDAWYNSTSNTFKGYQNSAVTNFITAASPSANRIPYFTNLARLLVTTGFEFNGTTFTTPNVVSAGRITATTTATLPGFNPGTFAGDPSTLVNGDFWYNSTSHLFRGRVNAATVTFITGSTGSTDNALLRANGTGGGSLQTTPAEIDDSANLILGNSSVVTSAVTITAINSTGNATINIEAQSGGNLNLVALQGEISHSVSDGTYAGRVNFAAFNTGLGSDGISIAGQNSATTAVRGTSVLLAAGNATVGNADGGNVYIRRGTGIGSGVNGNIIMDNLPVSAAGLPTGALWNNGGTLSIA